MLVTSFTAEDPKGHHSRFLPPGTAPQSLLACCQLQRKSHDTSNPELLSSLAPKFTPPSLYLIKRKKKKNDVRRVLTFNPQSISSRDV